MESWASRISLETVIWLFPLVFLIHDAEEILTVERWVKSNKQVLRKRFGGRKLTERLLRRAEQTTTARFSTMVACLFVAVCVASYLGTTGRYLWFVAGLTVLFLNVFTHIGQTLGFGGYTPGVASAIVVALPYSVYALARLLTADLIPWRMVWFSLPCGVVLLGLILLAGNLVGRALFPSPEESRLSIVSDPDGGGEHDT